MTTFISRPYAITYRCNTPLWGNRQCLRPVRDDGDRCYMHRALAGAVIPRAVTLPSPQVAEAVHHPPHYTTGTIEVITVIEDWDLNFNEGNIVKYVARARRKGKHLEDLMKARQYLDFEIARVKRCSP